MNPQTCPKKNRQDVITQDALDSLAQSAMRLGASAAKIISSADIVVEKGLADLCGGDPRCEAYGLAPSCPPHVAGPDGFRKWQNKSSYSIVVRIDVPTAAMFSDERREIMQLLHEIVAGVEEKASAMGQTATKAFAGGSCKSIFCRDHTTCRVLSKEGECRNPQFARPSMSGFGINVSKLMHSCGWLLEKATRTHASDEESMTWVAGLIMIANGEG